MKKSPYYKQIRIPLGAVQITRTALAKKWSNDNKKPVRQWPGYHHIKNILV